MKICYFGNCNLTFGRSYALSKGLKLAGATLIECQSKEKGLLFYIDLYKKHKAIKNEYDVLFIGNSGPSNFLPLFAQLLSRKKVIWEPLFSIYDNYIFDRKVAHKFSLKAFYYFSMDWVGVRSSDLIVLDTENNCRYFQKTFGGDDTLYTVALSGPNTNVFYPRRGHKNTDVFEVEYHGKYIPVQGTKIIVQAAKLLESDEQIHFTMIGGGQSYKETVSLAKELNVQNITFVPFQPLEEVVKYIARADVCMGLLGDIPRVHRAIPNKLYEAAAMSRVSINADTQALREVFTPGIDVIAVPPGNVQALAEAIVSLKMSGDSEQMGKKAFKTISNNVSMRIIGIKLLNDIKRVTG